MSTVTSTALGTDLGHEVLRLIALIKPHVPRITNTPTWVVKVKVDDDVVHHAIAIEAGERHRLTAHGLVRKKATWRRVVLLGHSSVCMMGAKELNEIRLQLTEILSHNPQLVPQTV